MRTTLRYYILSSAVVLSLISPAVRPSAAGPPPECGTGHFAPSVFRRGSGDDAFLRDWYSAYLRAMEEPPLSCGKVLGESYRLLWRRTWHHPVSVRILRTDTEVALTAVELDGAGGFEPGAVVKRVEKRLDKAQWARLKRALATAGYLRRARW
jgi:hypothetical protein